MAMFDKLLSALKGGAQNRVPLSGSAWTRCAPLFAGSSARAEYDYERAVRESFLGNPIAQRAVRIVAESLGQAPVYANDERLMKLVAATSAGQSLIETLAAHLLLHGNAYVQVLKDTGGHPVELFALRPERVSAVSDARGWPIAYDYKVDGVTTRITVQDEDGWPSLIHIKAMHPLDDYVGAGALSAAWQAVTIHNAAAEWNRALLENAARPSGALVYEAGDGAALSQEQFNRLRGELDTAFSGSANAGRPMLLDGGLKWQSMALSPADMDFATLKSAAARDIALAFGVPPMLLGLPGDNTYSNYREANRALWRLTLLPLAHKLLSALAEGLGAWFPGGTLEIDLDLVPALSEDRERLWSQVSDADFLTRAEKRELLGFDPEETAP